jgi:hypothetical protein
VIIKVDFNNNDFLIGDLPARLEVYIAGLDNKEEVGDKDIEEAPLGEDKPINKDL